MAHADDPYALNADGTAADPLAFQAALRADASKMAELEADPELQGVLLGPDTAAMQALLQQAFQVRELWQAVLQRVLTTTTGTSQRARGNARACQHATQFKSRSSQPALNCCQQLAVRLQLGVTVLQAASNCRMSQAQMAKAKDMGRWMAERTIDAQRASATVSANHLPVRGQKTWGWHNPCVCCFEADTKNTPCVSDWRG
jgi:hypothetical protein